MIQAQDTQVSYHKLFQMYSIMADVVGAADLTPHMRRVTLGGEGLGALAGNLLPADALKLYLPQPGQPAPFPRMFNLTASRKTVSVRAYTVRRFRPEVLELDLDMFIHGDSPGSVWARTAQPGDAIGFIGPRHDYRGAPGADWQVLAGDESALPAIAAILEQLPAGVKAQAFLEVNDASDELPIETRAAAEIHWLHRKDAPARDSRLLEEALRQLRPPAGHGHCWVAGHSTAVRSIRHLLLHDWRLTKEQVVTTGYWS